MQSLYSLNRSHVITFVAAGGTYKDAARRYGIASATAWRWVHADLANPPQRNPHLSAAVRHRIRCKIDAGELSLREIGRLFDVHHTTVSKIRDLMTTGGHAAHEHRCPTCRARITTRVCLRCQLKN
jgi:transposase-like protein